MAILSSLLYSNPEVPIPEDYSLPRRAWPGEINLEQSTIIPSITFSPLRGSLYDRSIVVDQIMTACLDYGMFEVVDHEVPEDAMNNALRSSASFFNKPDGNLTAFSNENCRLYSGSLAKNLGLERESYWRDTLSMRYNTGFPAAGWPTDPDFRIDLWLFATELSVVRLRLLSLISQGLRIPQNYFNTGITGANGICINHYPKCKYPTRTLGSPKHGEPNLITISLQGDVPGLQIYTDGQWKTVVTSKNALLVTMGYQMEVVSNGAIKTPQQRVVVNPTSDRTTVSFKIAPVDDYVVTPSLEPKKYKDLTYRDFVSIYDANEKDTDTISPYILK